MFEEDKPVTQSTAVDEHTKAILEKYGNDPAKLAQAYREMQSKTSKLENEYRPPKDYDFPQSVELDDSTRKSLLDTAREGGLTQRQFEALARKVGDSRQKALQKGEEEKRLREAALGGLDEVEKLRSFYANRLPPAVLDRILTNGTYEEIHELKRERNRILEGETSPALGDNKVEYDPNPKNLNKEYAEKTHELRKVLTKKRRATPQEQIDLEAKAKELASDAAKIKEAIRQGLNK